MLPLLAFDPRGDVANFSPPAPRAAARESRSAGLPDRVADRRPTPISATILTKNSERLLAQVLAALAWCDDVVVLDTGSTDGTAALARTFANVRYFELRGGFPGFGRAHQQAVGLARHDWILSVDSDEVVSPEAAAEIRALALHPDTVYSVPFQNYFNGTHITTCGWSPDRHERLFNRRVTNFCASDVHERVQTRALAVVRLRHPILHYSYQTTEDFLIKMPTYARLFAGQNTGRKQAGPAKAVARGAWAFFKIYLLERGFRQGTAGLTISAYKSQVVFWKYLLLREANDRAAARPQ